MKMAGLFMTLPAIKSVKRCRLPTDGWVPGFIGFGRFPAACPSEAQIPTCRAAGFFNL